MKTLKKLVLLLALLLVIGLLRAQVQCNYFGLKDTLSKNVMTNMSISNSTETEIHAAFDARFYAGDGQLIYHYHVPKMVAEPGNSVWFSTPKEDEQFAGSSTYPGGLLLVDQLDLSSYTGDLRISLTLHDTLDIYLIISHTELTIPLSSGIIDFDQMKDDETRRVTGYFDGLKVEFPEVPERFTPANLRELVLVNTSSHTICDDLEVNLSHKNSVENFYEFKLTNICVPPGRHTLSPAQFAAAIIDDRFEYRDTLRPLQVLSYLAGKPTFPNGKPWPDFQIIPTKNHGAQAFPIKTHYNPALNLSLDFLLPQDSSELVLPPNKVVLVENTEGQILKFIRSDQHLYLGPDLRPASPFGDVFISRSANCILSYTVNRSDDLNNKQLVENLAKMASTNPVNIAIAMQGDFEIFFPTTPKERNALKAEEQTGITFAIKYQNLLFHFYFRLANKGKKATAFIPADIINSIELNGHRFVFSFPDKQAYWPTDVSILPGNNTSTLPKEEYLTRLKTFLVYAEESEGKAHDKISLRGDAGAERIQHLLTFSYAVARLDTIEFPALQRQLVGGNNNFAFKQHSEEGFDAEWGVPESIDTAGFLYIEHLLPTNVLNFTFALDKDANLVASSAFSSNQHVGNVAQEITVSGRRLTFISTLHSNMNPGNLSFSVAQLPVEGIPKDFFRAITIQPNSQPIEIKETILHRSEQYNIYSSPLTTGFFSKDYPGLSLLITGGEHLYLFTVSGINEGEVLAWLRTIKVEGKALNIESQSSGDYNISLE